MANADVSRKDQTYALYNLTQEQLSHTLMPIGTYEKDEIRRIAQKAGISVAQKADSQDICFIRTGIMLPLSGITQGMYRQKETL